MGVRADLDGVRERAAGTDLGRDQGVRDPEDVLVDAMRGRYKVWWRIRVNLRNVPKELRPAAEPPDPDYDPWAEFRERGIEEET